MRPTAHQLAKIMSDQEGSQVHPTAMRDILTGFAAPVWLDVDCNECSKRTTDMYYHCNICDRGNFDLCPACIERGIHCSDPHHRLRKFTWKYGGPVGEMIDGEEGSKD